MLLHRFPIKVMPNMEPTTKSEGIGIHVSLYRKSVDPIYQNMVIRKVNQGELDDYIQMVLTTILKSGKLKCIFVTLRTPPSAVKIVTSVFYS